MNNVSSIYALVPVGWVERSSNGHQRCASILPREPLLFSRLVLKICRVKPNALRDLELWRVGFRYVYLLEGFIAHQSCVYN